MAPERRRSSKWPGNTGESVKRATRYSQTKTDIDTERVSITDIDTERETITDIDTEIKRSAKASTAFRRLQENV